MPTTLAPVVDALRALLEAEQESVFRLMRRDSPYLAAAPEDVREAVDEVGASIERQGDDLRGLIRQVGGDAPPNRPPTGNDTGLLGYLSLKFLMPKLVEEKSLCLRRYDNTLRAIERVAPPVVTDSLKKLQEENRGHLARLKQKSDEVIAASR